MTLTQILGGEREMLICLSERNRRRDARLECLYYYTSSTQFECFFPPHAMQWRVVEKVSPEGGEERDRSFIPNFPWAAAQQGQQLKIWRGGMRPISAHIFKTCQWMRERSDELF